MLEDTNPDAAPCTGMYLVQNVHIKIRRKQRNPGKCSPTNNTIVGIYGLSRADRWEDMPSMSSEVGDT